MNSILYRPIKVFLPCLIASLAPATAFADDPLALKVQRYDVQEATVIDGLRELKSRIPDRKLVFSLEVAPFRKEPERNLSLHMRDSTVRQVLDAIISADPRYTYEIVESAVVHVYPVSFRNDLNDLLNVRVKRTDLSGAAYDVMLKYPRYFIPELGTEILRRSGAKGATISMMGDADAPQVSVMVADGTVRDVLNRVALETLKFHQGRHRPTGWLYTYRIDESLPLGGEPRWELL